MPGKNEISPIVLFAASTVLLSLAWLMKSFPLLIFIGYAPLIAIASKSKKGKPVWSSIELILLSLAISFYAATFFELNSLVWCTIEAIVMSSIFLLYSYMRKMIGEGISVITIALFWLSLEYLFIKIDGSRFTFLADALQLMPGWVRWNYHTGYLGASLWILTCNLLLYKGALANKKLNWIYISLFIISVIAPMVYSYSLGTASITREQMNSLYNNSIETLPLEYLTKGEFVTRTSAWISVLILIYISIRIKITKK